MPTLSGWNQISFMTLVSYPLPRLAIWISMGVPLAISFVSTVVDEMAEGGAEKFRVKHTIRRGCTNSQWSFAAFYLGVSRGVLFPNATSDTRDIALAMAFVSLFSGLVGIIAIKRLPWFNPFLFLVTFTALLWVGTKL